jgi:erythromycin esterase
MVYNVIGGGVFMKKVVLLLASILVVVGGIYFFVKKDSESVDQEIGDAEREVAVEIANEEWVQWIKENSIDIGNVTDSSVNMEFIDEIARNKDYLFLGENSHGVSEYNSFKSSLIKYLHEKHDFDVIAFESGLGEVSASYAEAEQTDSETTMKNAIFQVWHSEEILPLFDYITEKRESDNPLILTGFDMQPMGSFPAFIQNWFNKVDPVMAEKVMDVEAIYRDHTLGSRNIMKEQFIEDKEKLLKGYEEAIAFIHANEKELQDVYPDEPNLTQITIKTFENRIEALTDLYSVYDFEMDIAKHMDARDKIMSSNIEWLMNTIYRGKKIIFWGHNYHIRDNNTQVESENLEMGRFESKSMFEYLPKEIKEKSYVLGLYMHGGFASYNGGHEYEVNSQHNEYEKDSLEQLLYHAKGENIFINIEGQAETTGTSWMFQPIHALDWGLYKERLILNNHYDGIVLFKTVHSPNYR